MKSVQRRAPFFAFWIIALYVLPVLTGPTHTRGQIQPGSPNDNELCRFSGHVIDQKGQLVPFAKIHIRKTDSVQVEVPATLADVPVTDTEGRFHILVPKGEYLVSARLPNQNLRNEIHDPNLYSILNLTPSRRTYSRLVLPVVLPIHPGSGYLRGGVSDEPTIWTKWAFAPDGMMASGAPPKIAHDRLMWGQRVGGLQAALVLAPIADSDLRTATLIVRNELLDRMLDFDRYRVRENFAFEIIHSDGSIQEIKRNIWPLNRIKPEYQLNRVVLRPRDEYAIDLGEIDLSDSRIKNTGVSIRGRINLFTHEKGPDRPLEMEFTTSNSLEAGWLSLRDTSDSSALRDKLIDDPAVQLIVIDAQTGLRIPKFAAFLGISPERIQFRQQDSYPVWQPTVWRSGLSGRLDWKIDNLFQASQFRIEAEGYAPGISQVIHQYRGPLTILIKLNPYAETVGQILGPDGKPAHRAQVAVIVSGSRVDIVNGTVVPIGAAQEPNNHWHQQICTETDIDGRFRMPPEVSHRWIIATHESGFAEVRHDHLTAESSKITLSPWGEIRGRLLWGARPGANEEIVLRIEHAILDGSLPLIWHRATATTDRDGRFVFHKVPPGRAHLHRDHGNDVDFNQRHPWTFEFPDNDVFVSANTPTSVVLGGRGRPVTGRLVGRADWTGVTIRISRPIPQTMLKTEEQRNAFRLYRKSVEGKAYFPEKVAVGADGTFRIDRVPGTICRWQVEEPGQKAGSVRTIETRDFYLPSDPLGTSDKPFDLGELTIEMK